MKNKINIFLLSFLIFLLTSCFSSNNDDVNKAKEELLNGNNPIEEDYTGTNISNDTQLLDEQNIKIEEEKVIINELTKESFIKLNDINENDLASLGVEITGATTTNVDKIVVNFSNTGSKFVDDNYTLKTFKSGDKTFLYRAFLKYETMDYGRNVYLLEAYSGDKVSRTELILNVTNPNDLKTNDSNLSSEKEPVESEKVDISNLPVGQHYGNPVELGDSKITYSDIKGLQIEKITDTTLTLDSDSVNSFLSDRVDGWFFWNSLRPISNNEGVSFFVIRLDGTKYIYEKHYFTPDLYYGVLQLETGEGVDISNISDKNTELKLKNDTYATITIADLLFKNILSK